MLTTQGSPKGPLMPFAGFLPRPSTRTMSIQVGGVPMPALLEQVRDVRDFDTYAEEMMQTASLDRVGSGWDRFVTSPEEEDTTQIVLSPGDLGFLRNPTEGQFFSNESLALWSVRNLRQQVVQLNHISAGAHVALKYNDQPIDEVLHIASKPMWWNLDIGAKIFTVERGVNGRKILGSADSCFVDLDALFLFRLYEIE